MKINTCTFNQRARYWLENLPAFYLVYELGLIGVFRVITFWERKSKRPIVTYHSFIDYDTHNPIFNDANFILDISFVHKHSVEVWRKQFISFLSSLNDKQRALFFSMIESYDYKQFYLSLIAKYLKL